MDAQGACYAEIASSPYEPQSAQASDASLVRWSAGSDTQPQVVAGVSLPGRYEFACVPIKELNKVRVVATGQRVLGDSGPPAGGAQMFWTDSSV
jgi:hypothetical protein